MKLSSRKQSQRCLLPQKKLRQRSASGSTVISRTLSIGLITLPKIRASTNETHRNWDAENCLVGRSLGQPVAMGYI
jgi:hypothetical protein